MTIDTLQSFGNPSFIVTHGAGDHLPNEHVFRGQGPGPDHLRIGCECGATLHTLPTIQVPSGGVPLADLRKLWDERVGGPKP